MNEKHSPEPRTMYSYHNHAFGKKTFWWVKLAYRELKVATIPRTRANAALISAAPELLAALKNLVDQGLILDPENDHFEEAVEVIAKAEGKEARHEEVV